MRNNSYYTKTIDGVLVKKLNTDIIIYKDGLQTINPSEEMLIADGWEVYTAPEVNKEMDLHTIKCNKIVEIKKYDKSNAVNTFYVHNFPVWLDKETRTGLMLRLQAEETVGKTETTLWYNGTPFTFELEQGRQMLYLIENYASMCFDTTQQHIANVRALETIEEVEAYDHTANYPEKLNF